MHSSRRELGVVIDVVRNWGLRGVLALGVAVLSACAEGGSPPVLATVADQVGAVGQELVIELRASDADADSLEFGFSADVEGIAERASMSARPDGIGVFRWTPLAEDVGTWFFDFTVTDGQSRDTVTARVEVRSSLDGSAPVFRQPLGSGTTLDLSVADCLDLDVVVDDPDDTEVEITQAEPVIEGAELQLESGLNGVWRWCPSKTQLQDDRHPLTLMADDGDHPPTIKNYLIVLRQGSQPDCPGEGPVVAHEPADAQTVLDLEVRARISDDVGLKHEPLVYYSNVEPKLPIDFSQFDLVEMELRSGDLRDGEWTARLPNPVASGEPGDQATLWYIVSAGDNDDEAGDCDHVTDAPADGAFAMKVTRSEGYGGLPACEPCSADPQCGDGDDLCHDVQGDGTLHCGRGCTTNDDCDDGYACLPVESVDGAAGTQCVPQAGTCESDDECEDDGFEDNDSRNQASAQQPVPFDAHDDLVSCNGDEDWYKVEVEAAGTLGAVIEGAGGTNLNVALYDEQGNAIEVAEAPSSSELVEACVEPGIYYVRVYAFGDAPAGFDGYDLLLDHAPGECSSTCQDDDFEDDDGLSEATAASIYPNVYTTADRMICEGDDDWYEIELFTGETVFVDLTFVDDAPGEDLDLHFHDEEGVDLTPCSEESSDTCSDEQGQSADSNEHYEFTLTQAGCAPCVFYVVVHGWAGSENEYDLSIELQE